MPEASYEDSDDLEFLFWLACRVSSGIVLGDAGVGSFRILVFTFRRRGYEGMDAMHEFYLVVGCGCRSGVISLGGRGKRQAPGYVESRGRL